MSRALPAIGGLCKRGGKILPGIGAVFSIAGGVDEIQAIASCNASRCTKKSAPDWKWNAANCRWTRYCPSGDTLTSDSFFDRERWPSAADNIGVACDFINQCGPHIPDGPWPPGSIKL